MKLMKQMIEILKNGCFIFTPVIILMYIAGNLISATMVPDLKAVILVLVFSLLLAAANRILRIPTLKHAVRVCIHFLVCTCVYYFVIIVCTGNADNGIITILALSVFVVLYAAVLFIILLKQKLAARKINDKKEYESVFKG